MDIEMLKDSLSNNIIALEFDKVDGTHTIRHATTMRRYITQISSGRGKTPNPDILTFWDVDVNDWRSCRINSITSWHVVGN